MTTTALHPLRELEDYVLSSTIVYRKGDVVKHYSMDHVDVISIDNFPELPKGLNTAVDCHFVTVGFTENLATWDHREFYDRTLAAERGAFADMTLEVWEQGPSYITIGAWIGDQTTAFRFMACAQAHGLGHVITPASLGITGTAGDAIAGGGMILLSGLKEPS